MLDLATVTINGCQAMARAEEVCGEGRAIKHWCPGVLTSLQVSVDAGWDVHAWMHGAAASAHWRGVSVAARLPAKSVMVASSPSSSSVVTVRYHD